MKVQDVQNITFELTSHCNARCPQCQRFDLKNDLRKELILSHSDVDIMLRNLHLDKMSNLKTIKLEGTVGDPCMHPELEKIIDYLCNLSSKPTVELVTNGSIRSSEWWKKLGKNSYNNLLVYFSIDGLEDTNHLYRVGVNFNRVIENACAFISNGGNAIWKCIIFKHNQHQIDQIHKNAKNMKFLSIEFTPSEHFRFGIFTEDDYQWFDKWPTYNKNKQITHYIEYTDLEENCITSRSENFKPFTRNSSVAQCADQLCPYLNNGEIFITYRHHVLPCCMMYNELYLDHLGAIRMQKELVVDLDTIDITKYNINEIFSNSNFYNNNLNDHFLNGPWLPVCAKSCKNDIINLIYKQ